MGGLYSVLWGKCKESQEKEKNSIPVVTNHAEGNEKQILELPIKPTMPINEANVH